MSDDAWRKEVNRWRVHDHGGKYFLWAERAAIREIDGGMSRDEAERKAYEDVIGIYARRS